MSKLARLCALFIFVLFSALTYGQSSAGTEFYLTFLTNSSSLITLSVNISAITNAKVILTGPGFL
ncbi:MAG: hypothetical protein ACJAZ3_001273, partial [Sphingobacteriales bacterium]